MRTNNSMRAVLILLQFSLVCPAGAAVILPRDHSNWNGKRGVAHF